MRGIDVSELEALGSNGAGPWRLGEDRLLRMASGGRPLRSPEEAGTQLEVYNAARAAGVPTPEGFEVVCLEGLDAEAQAVGGGTYGVVVEFVAGVPLPIHVAFGSFEIEEAGREVGALQRRLHTARISAGRDWNAELRQQAHGLRPHLPPAAGRRLATLIEAVPASAALLHGDLHPGNVVVNGEEIALIDMEFAGFGNPAIDLAISRMCLIRNGLRNAMDTGLTEDRAAEYAQRYWEAQLHGYLGDAGQEELAEIDRRLTVLGEVLWCGKSRRFMSTEENRSSDAFAEGISKILDNLPRIDRLDLGD